MIHNINIHIKMAMFIDTETSGLPDTHNLRWGVYPYYKHLDKYANARIVQFSMLITDNQFNDKEVKDFIIKRDGFDIANEKFHGITNEISDTIGVSFDTVAIDIFYELLKKVSHIIAHNVAFDVGVIKSELYRRGLKYIIEELDKKTLLIKDVPYSVTTTQLMESITKANDQGKIKIKKVIDVTAADVEIQIDFEYLIGIPITNVSIVTLCCKIAWTINSID